MIDVYDFDAHADKQDLMKRSLRSSASKEKVGASDNRSATPKRRKDKLNAYMVPKSSPSAPLVQAVQDDVAIADTLVSEVSSMEASAGPGRQRASLRTYRMGRTGQSVNQDASISEDQLPKDNANNSTSDQSTNLHPDKVCKTTDAIPTRSMESRQDTTLSTRTSSRRSSARRPQTLPEERLVGGEPNDVSGGYSQNREAQQDNIFQDDDDLLATPKVTKSTKKVLVGNVVTSDDDSDLLDSPSKRKVSLRASRSGITPGKNGHEPAQRQLFSASVLVSPKIDSRKSPIPSAAILTPQKSRLNQLQLQVTPTNLPLSTPRQTLTKSSPKKRLHTAVPSLEVSLDHILFLKSHVMSRLTGGTPLLLLNRKDQFAAVHGILRETILRSMSNSALLLGPRSTGKSLVVETALKDFKDAGEEFLVVRLNGLVHTDDKIALRAIARQLQPDSEDIANADIMTALIAILSHPRDFGESGDPLSTIILLEHFDKFTQHPRQTLLYNLFDIAQSRKAPICVLGMTSKVDAYEALEKRVKSRFSHRVVQFHSLNYEQFRAVALSSIQFQSEWPEAVVSSVPRDEMDQMNKYIIAWNQYIADSTELDDFIRYVYLTSSDVKYFFSALLPEIVALGRVSTGVETPSAFPSFTMLLPGVEDLSTQGKAGLLTRLSTLALGLLISAARVALKSGLINFSTTFDEFHQLSSKSIISQRITGIVNSRIYSAQVSMRAWDELLQEGLLVLVKGSIGNSNRTFGGNGWEFKAVSAELGLHHILAAEKASAVKIPSVMKSWLTLG